jgi:serine-type D-Ala-D-Ala carboxypeptidase
LVELGLLDLDQPISRWLKLPGEEKTDLAGLTPGQLLSHTSGLPAWRPYYKELVDLPLLDRPGRLLELIAAEPLEAEPGRKTIYSDLGYLLLQMIIEEISGVSLAEYVVMNFCQPLGLHDLGFVILPDGPGYNRGRFVASERCPWRERLLQGEVSDDNAWALGGFGGQAGMFGRGRSVFRLMDWLAASAAGRAIPRMISPATAGLIFERPEPRCTRTFGFDTPTGVAPSAGRLARGEMIGHLGFTGTSLWHRREDGLTVVLLTNRIIFGRDNRLIRNFRVLIHDLVDYTLSN